MPPIGLVRSSRLLLPGILSLIDKSRVPVLPEPSGVLEVGVQVRDCTKLQNAFRRHAVLGDIQKTFQIRGPS